MLSASGQERFLYSTAMINAYFSCLDDRLILLGAFSDRPLGSEALGLYQPKDPLASDGFALRPQLVNARATNTPSIPIGSKSRAF